MALLVSDPLYSIASRLQLSHTRKHKQALTELSLQLRHSQAALTQQGSKFPERHAAAGC